VFLSATFVCSYVCSFISSGQVLLPLYLVNDLSSLDETYREYSLAPTDDTDDLIREVTAGRRGGDAGALKSIF